jgi:small-conductance mechanosensitive channel/CRP-like cAMP-binding protein
MLTADALRASTGLLVLGFLVAAVLLWLLARGERRAILVATGLFFLSLALHALAGAIAPGPAAVVLRASSDFLLGVGILSLVGIAVFRVILPAVRMDSPRILQDVAMTIAYLVWAFILLRLLGWDPTTVVATSAVVTAVIAFSLQDTLGNILGGLAIQVERSLHVGDWIKLDDVVGRVVQVRWRYTGIETRNWETAIIPNSLLVKNKVIVLGRREGQPVQWRRWVWFNVDYRHPPPKVIEAVESTLRAAQIKNVAAVPPPNCVQMDFVESYGRYAVRYWLTDLAADDPTDSEVRAHVYYALSRAGIPLALPEQTVLLSQEKERAEVEAEEALAHRAEAIRHVDLFDGLQREEHAVLARRLVAAPFAAGDIITRQGATAHWLYILVEGRADVIVQNAGGESVKVAQLSRGSFFGEWGLLTGDPRHATVVARTDVECYRLDKESFRTVLLSRPAIADEISALLAQRRTELDARLHELDDESRAHHVTLAQGDILAKICHLFGIDRPGRGQGEEARIQNPKSSRGGRDSDS